MENFGVENKTGVRSWLWDGRGSVLFSSDLLSEFLQNGPSFSIDFDLRNALS